MGLELPALLALSGAGVSLIGAEQQAQGARTAGKYAKAVGERNFKVAETKAEMRVFQAAQDIVRFREDFRDLNDSSGQAFRFNGVVATEGTALDVQLANALEADIEIATIDLNARREAQDLRDQGLNARLEGDLRNYESKVTAGAIRMGAIADTFKAGATIAQA